MPILIDNQIPAMAVSEERLNLAAGRISQTFAPLLDRCNSYRNSVGSSSGRACLLLLQRDVLTLMKADQQAKAHTLSFRVNSNKYTDAITIQKLFFMRAVRLTFGHVRDENHVYYVEFCDPRWFARNPHYQFPTVASFNVRTPAGGQTYYQDSLNNGNPYTWQGILDGLWSLINIPEMGGSPTIPADAPPVGTPEGFRFVGMSAWQAYNEVLARIGCVFQWDAQAGKAGIAYLAATDATFNGSLAANQDRVILDTNPQVSTFATVPNSFRIYHRQIRQHYGTEKSTGWATGEQDMVSSQVGGPLYQKTTQAPANLLNQTKPNTMGFVLDDLPSIIDFDGNVTNQAALDARDTDRTADYYNALQGVGLNPRLVILSGLISDNNLVLPRGWVSGVRWAESGAGYITEIVRYPPWTPPDAVKFSEDAPWDPWGGGEKAAQQLQAPIYGRTKEPTYPPLMQPVKVTGAAVVANVYPGVVLRINPTGLAQSTGETCWIHDPTGTGHNNGDIITSARLNGAATYNMETNPRPLYLVSCCGGGIFGAAFNANQQVAANTVTALAWGSGRSSFWSNSNPTRLTVPAGQPTGGLYNAVGQVLFQATSINAGFSAQWFKNGNYASQVQQLNGSCTGGNTALTAADSFILNPGDYLELVVWHNQNALITVTAVSSRIEYEGVY